jgi:HAD superfamily hydrolase (TIGR01509 family)
MATPQRVAMPPGMSPGIDAAGRAWHDCCAMPLRLVIFDLDGTLLEPMLDFAAVRAEIGLPPAAPILEAMACMDDAGQARARAILDRREAEAAGRSQLMPGARDLVAHLRSRGIKVAVLTRNSRPSVDLAVRRHGLSFDASVTRDEQNPKPSPEGVHRLMDTCGTRPEETILVGDYRFDIEAGRRSGVRTIALAAQAKEWAKHATWAACSLAEVQRLLDTAAQSPV